VWPKKYSKSNFLYSVLLLITAGFVSQSMYASSDDVLEAVNRLNRTSTDVRYVEGHTEQGEPGVHESTFAIMERQQRFIPTRRKHHIHRDTGRSKHLPQNPLSPHVSSLPGGGRDITEQEIEACDDQTRAVQFSFLGGSLNPHNILFPPDSMGVVGPTQFIVCINGLLKTFDKTTGNADGVLDVDTDVFFSSVLNGSFSSDPRIRYDRLSDRWFIIMINVPNTNNRIMFAVSDSGTITNSTNWSFFKIQADTHTFFDYPTLGIDQNALYVGGATFSNNDTGRVYVVNKSSLISGGPIVFTKFSNLINPTTFVGPYAPQGVDNFDANPTNGYFIAVDNATFGTLVLVTIANPGGSPSLASIKTITVPSTQFPLTVPHKGNSNGRNGQLDAIDDRTMMGVIRNGKLWTVHNIGINNSGVSRRKLTKDGSRYYQLDLAHATPQILQVGTLFQPGTTSLYYWMPSLMISGQNHMLLGTSVAGPTSFIDASTATHFANDPLGTIGSPVRYTATTTAYNPPDDPGSSQGGSRRWGDYSYTSLDPCDNMTMWTIQEICSSTNKWGVQVAKFLAPLPAAPTSASPSSVASGNASVNVHITGSVANNSGFYDPGVAFNCRIGATVSGGVVVNSVTFVSPTSVNLNISTVGASTGAQDVTIINPDGQQATGVGILTVT